MTTLPKTGKNESRKLPSGVEVHLEHLAELVVNAANESGGYGMLVGPHSTTEQYPDFAKRIQANPRNCIAQPTLSLSHVPTLVGDDTRETFFAMRPVAGLAALPG